MSTTLLSDGFDAVPSGTSLAHSGYSVDGTNGLGVADSAVYTQAGAGTVETSNLGSGWATASANNTECIAVITGNHDSDRTLKLSGRLANTSIPGEFGVFIYADDTCDNGVLVAMDDNAGLMRCRWFSVSSGSYTERGTAAMTGASNSVNDIEIGLSSDGSTTITDVTGGGSVVLFDAVDMSAYQSAQRVGLRASQVGHRITDIVLTSTASPVIDGINPEFDAQYVAYGDGVRDAARAIYRGGDARVLFMGDSFSSHVPSPAGGGARLPLEWWLYGGFPGRVTAINATPWPNQGRNGSSEIVFHGPDDMPGRWDFVTASNAESDYNISSNGPARYSGPESSSPQWDPDGTSGSGPAVWHPVISGKLGAGETTTAGESTSAVEVLRHELCVGDSDADFWPLRSPATDLVEPDGTSIRWAVRMSGPVVSNRTGSTHLLYFMDIGETGSTDNVTLTGSTGARFNASGAFQYEPLHSASGFSWSRKRAAFNSNDEREGAAGTAGRWQRYIMSGDSKNANGDLVVTDTDADGTPVFALRFSKTAYLSPGADAGKWWTLGSLTWYACDADRDDEPVPGIYLDGPFAISSGDLPEVGGTHASGTSTAGDKRFDTDNLRDYIRSGMLRADQPLVVFVHFATESRTSATHESNIENVFETVDDATRATDGGDRIAGYDFDLHIVFVVPFMHSVAGSFDNATVSSEFQECIAAAKEAVDDFHDLGRDRVTVGVVSMYDDLGGNIFGETGSGWDSTAIDNAEQWLRNNGYTSLADSSGGDLLDGSDLHIKDAPEAAVFVRSLERGLRAALPSGGFLSRSRPGRTRGRL